MQRTPNFVWDTLNSNTPKLVSCSVKGRFLAVTMQLNSLGSTAAPAVIRREGAPNARARGKHQTVGEFHAPRVGREGALPNPTAWLRLSLGLFARFILDVSRRGR